MTQFTDEDFAKLAQVERDMETGMQPYVRCSRDQRWAFPHELLDRLGVQSGQRVSEIMLIQLLEQNLARIEAMVTIDKAARH